jgi:hypothetical protein
MTWNDKDKVSDMLWILYLLEVIPEAMWWEAYLKRGNVL